MSAIANHPHRVTTAVADVRARLSSVAHVPLWSMDATETTTALAEIQAAKAQLVELEARMLCHAEQIDVPDNTGASSTANWYAVATNTVRPAAHRLMRIAAGLETHAPTRASLSEGRGKVEQGGGTLRALPPAPGPPHNDA